MAICPVAIAVGCKKCPVVSMCPLKTTLGDFKKDEPAKPAPGASAKPPKKPGG